MIANLKFVDWRHLGNLQNRNELPYKNYLYMLMIDTCIYTPYLEHSVLLFASFTRYFLLVLPRW